MQDKDKIAEYDRLAAENSELKSELENLRKQIACLKKAVYGPKSEKTEVILKDSQQMPLEGVFNEAETEEHKEESVTIPEHKRKKKRSREEIIGNLPTEEVVHYVEDRSCDVCGSEMTAVGKEFVRDELVYVPAKLFVRKHYSEVLKCTKCGADESRDAENEDVEKCRFKKADVPAPLIPHSFCSAELLAHIIYEKYINAVPLYRQEKSFKNIGADISRTTMANWIIYTALEKAKPIYSAMKRELLKDDFYAWLDSFSAAGGSALQKAVQYARNEKKYLYGFLENPDVEPHNNCAENAIRPFVVGRKNWLFSSSPKGAHTSAIIYSLAITAEKNGLNVEKYFTDLLSSPEPLMPY